jgi:ribosomal-protein-alanine acetyltransferase
MVANPAAEGFQDDGLPLLRPAGSKDLEAILAIESCWKTAPGWSRAQFERELAWDRSYLVVLEEGGLVLGYAGLWKLPGEGQITTLAVAPQAASRGRGRLLLNHLIAICRLACFQKISLEVSAENLPALRLYRRAGFQVVGCRAKFYNDGSDAILMDLPLVS